MMMKKMIDKIGKMHAANQTGSGAEISFSGARRLGGANVFNGRYESGLHFTFSKNRRVGV